MKNVFKVFKRDIKSIFTNPIALLIITGLCIIPSLYAWVNIKAAWDPYSNTGSLPVAVVNEDKGATLAGKSINIGDGIVDQLHSNDKIGWTFVSAEEGNVGLVDGKYYAMIEIPADFSKDLASITTDNPTKADIIYKVNTKVNPVANKITEVAESTLVTQIKTSFVESVNKELFTKLNTVGDQLNKNKENIINLKNSIININNNMGLINNVLDGVSSGATSLDSYINTVKQALPAISSSLSNVQSITVNTSSIIDNTNATLNGAFNNIGLNLETAKSNVENINASLKTINTDSVNAQQAKAIIANANTKLTNVDTSLKSIITFLEKINQASNSKVVNQMIDNVTNIKNSVENQMKSLSLASGSIDQAGKLKQSVIDGLTSGTNSISTSLGNAVSNYNSNTKGQLKSIGSNLSNTTKTAAGLINEANGLVGKVQNVVNSASSNTQMAASTAEGLQSTLNQFSGVISELAKNLGTINNNNLEQIIAVLQGNPAIMGNFISTPFNVQQKSVFKINDYGSGMAPLYTVLALWVGALLLTSLLKTNPPKFEGLEKISIRERYFGKLLTFMSICIIQALIVALGDKYILGVQTANLPLFIFVSVATSITFCIIIFTLVAIFGNFGKAIAIVLMVVQIAGTGGTYPVQVLPLFFRIVEPIMPFSYAVNVFREAIAGPIFSHVVSELIALATFSIIFLLLGYFLKPKLHGRLTKFEKKFEESGIGE
ncbi:MAG: YhgE/Pip domain-containing protein [Sarcina sp.]